MAWLVGTESYGAVSYSISGSHDQKNVGYYNKKSQSVSLGVDFELSDYFRIGFARSLEQEQEVGYKTDPLETKFLAYQLDSKIAANSVNLTLVPFHYYVTPFIFAGLGLYSISKTEVTDLGTVSGSYRQPGPQGGGGINIKVSERFGIKVTHTVSLGAVKTPEDRKGFMKPNATTRVGVTFTP